MNRAMLLCLSSRTLLGIFLVLATQQSLIYTRIHPTTLQRVHFKSLLEKVSIVALMTFVSTLQLRHNLLARVAYVEGGALKPRDLAYFLICQMSALIIFASFYALMLFIFLVNLEGNVSLKIKIIFLKIVSPQMCIEQLLPCLILNKRNVNHRVTLLISFNT